jgi:outer membrane protein OmpA-like peptidoglycan-associated protein
LSAGVRLAFGGTAALRVDGTREYLNQGDNIARHSNWGLRLGLSWMLPKRNAIGENLTTRFARPATLSPVRMPLLRESDPVAIMGLETERARRDSASRQDSIRTERTRRLAADVGNATPRDGVGATIHFDIGSSRIRSDASVALEETLDLLRRVPSLRIRIEGQADARGSTAYNITLAWDRAGAAKVWLTNHGMDPDRIDAVGYREGLPICEERNDACWSRMRSDEFVIVAGTPVVVVEARP